MSRAKETDWYFVEVKRPWKPVMKVLAKAESRVMAWIFVDGKRRYIGSSVFATLQKAEIVRYALLEKYLKQCKTHYFPAANKIKMACEAALEKFDRSFLTSKDVDCKIKKQKQKKSIIMQINTDQMLWNPRSKNFEHRVDNFPLFLDVTSAKTGSVRKFVQDTVRAMKNEYWDGELMVYIPEDKNLKCTITFYRG